LRQPSDACESARRGHAKAQGHWATRSPRRHPANVAIADVLDALLVKRADEQPTAPKAGSSAVGEFEAIRDAFEAYEARWPSGRE
jgi:hypothetical protein